MSLLAAAWSLKKYCNLICYSWRNESVIHIVIFQTQSKNKEYFMLLYWLIAAAAIIIIMTTFALLNGTQFLAKTQLDSTKPQWSHCLSGMYLGPFNLGKVSFQCQPSSQSTPPLARGPYNFAAEQWFIILDTTCAMMGHYHMFPEF